MPYDGPSIDHSLLSPSGHISKRARKAANALHDARVAAWWCAKYPEPTEAEKAETARLARIQTLRLSAANLRDLASRGMRVRSYPKRAAEMEAEADRLSTPTPKGS